MEVNMNIENSIEIQYRELDNNDFLNPEYVELYESVKNLKLKEIFSSLHSNYVRLFRRMNERLPTHENTAHFWADPSRDLIKIIDITLSLEKILKSTQYAFEIDAKYNEFILNCRGFLSSSLGSEIPPNTDKIEIYYTIPIFFMLTSIVIKPPQSSNKFNLSLIGEGSYANVYKYKDTFYNKNFILKRAKKNLDEKEIERFCREFEEMKKLSSPYIVEVYKYNSEKNEYIMEFMDYTLREYIEKNQSNLTKEKRKGLCLQILRAFQYINSTNILHRDISPSNILIKSYDDVDVIKIADFGLVKITDSFLTSKLSEFKGSFNDPELATEGFYSYVIQHETYALTKIIYFVMTGKTNTSNIKDPLIKQYVLRGLNPDKSKRFQNANEMISALKEL